MMEGWGYKKRTTGIQQVYQRRYFILDASMSPNIKYSKNKGEAVRGEVPTGEIRYLYPSPPSELGGSKISTELAAFAMSIETPGRTYYLLWETAEDRNCWLSAIMAAALPSEPKLHPLFRALMGAVPMSKSSIYDGPVSNSSLGRAPSPDSSAVRSAIDSEIQPRHQTPDRNNNPKDALQTTHLVVEEGVLGADSVVVIIEDKPEGPKPTPPEVPSPRLHPKHALLKRPNAFAEAISNPRASVAIKIISSINSYDGVAEDSLKEGLLGDQDGEGDDREEDAMRQDDGTAAKKCCCVIM